MGEPLATLSSRFWMGASVIKGSGVAATKIKEWTLARTVTISKKENMMVMRKSLEQDRRAHV